MHNVSFETESIMFISGDDKSPIFTENDFVSWLNLNITGKFLIIDPRSLGTMKYLTNDSSDNTVDTHSMPGSVICMFEKLSGATLFKLTWG